MENLPEQTFSGQARDAAREIYKMFSVTGGESSEYQDVIAGIISKYLSAAAETVGERCGHGVVIGSACHYCPNTVAAKGESKEVNNA